MECSHGGAGNCHHEQRRMYRVPPQGNTLMGEQGAATMNKKTCTEHQDCTLAWGINFDKFIFIFEAAKKIFLLGECWKSHLDLLAGHVISTPSPH